MADELEVMAEVRNVISRITDSSVWGVSDRGEYGDPVRVLDHPDVILGSEPEPKGTYAWWEWAWRSLPDLLARQNRSVVAAARNRRDKLEADILKFWGFMPGDDGSVARGPSWETPSLALYRVSCRRVIRNVRENQDLAASDRADKIEDLRGKIEAERNKDLVQRARQIIATGALDDALKISVGAGEDARNLDLLRVDFEYALESYIQESEALGEKGSDLFEVVKALGVTQDLVPLARSIRALYPETGNAGELLYLLPNLGLEIEGKLPSDKALAWSADGWVEVSFGDERRRYVGHKERVITSITPITPTDYLSALDRVDQAIAVRSIENDVRRLHDLLEERVTEALRGEAATPRPRLQV